MHSDFLSKESVSSLELKLDLSSPVIDFQQNEKLALIGKTKLV
jgi:hypothetical protein